MSRSAVPDPLLAPLLDVAADVLLGLAPADVPPALRALATFDRRGLNGAAARPELRPAGLQRCDGAPAAATGARPGRRLPGRHRRSVHGPAGGGGGARRVGARD